MRVLLAAAFVAACSAADTQGQIRESPAEIRRIVAQAICLAEAYPDGPIAADSAAIVATYQGSLGPITVRELDAVRGLAKGAKPGSPTPIGQRNFGIARCILFADRPDVAKLLGAR